MAKCDVCGKGAHFGNNVSHSHRRSNHIWNSNVKNVKCNVNDLKQVEVFLELFLEVGNKLNELFCGSRTEFLEFLDLVLNKLLQGSALVIESFNDSFCTTKASS